MRLPVRPAARSSGISKLWPRAEEGGDCNKAALKRHKPYTLYWHSGRMQYLTADEQIFVLTQIRNWLLGRDGPFRLLNDAWSPYGAEAYFWS